MIPFAIELSKERSVYLKDMKWAGCMEALLARREWQFSATLLCVQLEIHQTYFRNANLCESEPF